MQKLEKWLRLALAGSIGLLAVHPLEARSLVQAHPAQASVASRPSSTSQAHPQVAVQISGPSSRILQVPQARSRSLRLEPRAPSAAWDPDLQPTVGYRDRQKAYLSACAASTTATTGGLYAQLCRLATNAGPVNAAAFDEGLNEINNREDTADFDLNAILRILALYSGHPNLDPALEAELVEAVLNFKYWVDEPGTDDMCTWSENHQVLFHAAEMLAGELFPDTVFPNSGMTGREHVAHALPLLETWLDYRGRFGFSEWHSNIYFNEDIPALVNVVDFAWDEAIAIKAAMVLDVVAFDLATNMYKGLFAVPHGRTYESTLIGGSDDSTTEAAYIMLGLGTPVSMGNFSATFLSTSSRYWPPAILENVAQAARSRFEHRQRDGIDVVDGPEYGISYDQPEDMFFWWGMEAYATEETANGTLEALTYYNMWENDFFDDVAFLRYLAGRRIVEPLMAAFEEIGKGVALESMSTYTWRTPYYQLSGAQDYKQGFWGAQTHMWQATLDANAVVFTTYPGGMEGDYMAGLWTGGFMPRGLFFENVGVIQYQRDRFPVLDKHFFVEFSHAYFPRWAFDEVRQQGSWTFGRKGDAYVALYSQNPTVWSTENDYELIADGRENTWLVELGSKAEWSGFDAFVSAIAQAGVWTSGGNVEYESPSQGTVSVMLGGPLFVDGIQADTGPYDRFDNVYANQPFGSMVTEINAGSSQLVLDFEQGLRDYTP